MFFLQPFDICLVNLSVFIDVNDTHKLGHHELVRTLKHILEGGGFISFSSGEYIPNRGQVSL